MGSPDSFRRQLAENTEHLETLRYSTRNRGCFWLQFVATPGSGIANSIVVLDEMAEPVTNNETIDYLAQFVSPSCRTLRFS